MKSVIREGLRFTAVLGCVGAVVWQNVPEEMHAVFDVSDVAAICYPGGHTPDTPDELSLVAVYDTEGRTVDLFWEARHGTSERIAFDESHTLSFSPTAMSPDGGTHSSLFIAGMNDAGMTVIEEWPVTQVAFGSTIHPTNGSSITTLGKVLRKRQPYVGDDIGLVHDVMWVRDRQRLWLLEYAVTPTVWEFDPVTGALHELVIPAVHPTQPVSSTTVAGFDLFRSMSYVVTSDGAIHYLFLDHTTWDGERRDVTHGLSPLCFEMVDTDRDGVIDTSGFLSPQDLLDLPYHETFQDWHD